MSSGEELSSSDDDPGSKPCGSITVEILIDEGIASTASSQMMQQAAVLAARSRGFDQGELGIRVTDDETIRELNRRHLEHDYATDVISFCYDLEQPFVSGELVVSVDTAKDRASEVGWDARNELLLYVVHGVLHIVGMEDSSDQDRAEMRVAESLVMRQLGIHDIERFAADRADTASDQEAANS